MLLAGCGDDDEIELGDFEGSWEATSFVVTAVDDPSLTLDVIALGADLTAETDADGGLEGRAVLPAAFGGQELEFGARFVLEDQETLTVDFDPEIPPLLTDYTGPFTLEGDTMTLNDPNTAFDFGSGEAVPATADLVLVRTSS
jgi:hypothetical protein